MISFVWSADYPFLAGAGGSENYTVGQIRELKRRGIACRILTLGFGTEDGREGFPDIEFKAVGSKHELSELDDTLVFITYPLDVATKKQSYVILHCPPPTAATREPLKLDANGIANKRIIAPSKYAARLWSRYYGRPSYSADVAYPFAEADFSRVERPERHTDKTRVLFASRLTPDKGIYTLLSSLHMPELQSDKFEFTVTTSGGHTPDGKLLLTLLEAHPRITVVSARQNSKDMARLMAQHDVVVMPTTNIFWKEIFGIVSVEAQHAGCRVVASKAGGISETNCGGLVLTRPDDPESLAQGLQHAANLGPLSVSERARASQYFTVKQSVDALLRIISQSNDGPQREPLRIPSVRIPQLSYRQTRWFPARLK